MDVAQDVPKYYFKIIVKIIQHINLRVNFNYTFGEFFS